MSVEKALGLSVAFLLVPCIVLGVQASATTPLQPESALERLQGAWTGEGPPGEIAITIEDDVLHFRAREDFWYEATFTLKADTTPSQLHATITDSAPPVKDVGVVVYAIFEIEDGTLTLAVGGADEAPASFAAAASHYVLKKTPA